MLTIVVDVTKNKTNCDIFVDNILYWFYNRLHFTDGSLLINYRAPRYHINSGTNWAPLRRQHFGAQFHEWKGFLLYKFHWNLFPGVQLTINQHGVILACCRSGDKWVSEPMMVYITDAYMRHSASMDLLPDTQNCGLRLRRECREPFPRHRLKRKPLVSDPAMHHGTCVMHVPWCMSGSLTRGGWENVLGITGACATRDFTYLARSPWIKGLGKWWQPQETLLYNYPSGLKFL